MNCKTCKFYQPEPQPESDGQCQKILSEFSRVNSLDWTGKWRVPPDFGCSYHEPKK